MCLSGGSFAAQPTQSAILLVCFLPATFSLPFFLVPLLRLLRLLPVAVLFLLADRPLVVGCRAHPDPKLRLHLPRSPPGPLPSFRLISTVPVLRSLRMRLDSPFKTSFGSIASSWAIVALIVGWPINLVSRLSMIDLAASIVRVSIGHVFLGLRLLPSRLFRRRRRLGRQLLRLPYRSLAVTLGLPPICWPCCRRSI